MATNIVEGCGAATQKEFARFLDIAIKSVTEVQYHLIIGRDRAMIAEGDWQALSGEVVQLRRMLYALRKRVLSALA